MAELIDLNEFACVIEAPLSSAFLMAVGGVL